MLKRVKNQKNMQKQFQETNYSVEMKFQFEFAPSYVICELKITISAA